MHTLVIVGAGGHGKVVADAAFCAGWHNIIFFDDAWPRITQLGRWKVIGTYNHLLNSKEYKTVVIAIGHNKTRLEKAHQLSKAGFLLTSIIHPAAVVSRDAKIGLGNVIFAGAVINPDAIIGNYCIINTNATIEHDCVLGNGVHIAPGAALGGGVTIGELSWIGMGASIRHLTIIGSSVLVGAGAAVVKNIPDHCTATGVPASFKE